MFDEDMSVFFNNDEHAVIAVRQLPDGAVESTEVLFDYPDSLFAGEMVQVSNAEITYPADKFPGLSHSDVLVIDSVQWKVTSEPEAIEDGRLAKATLKKVST